MNPFEEYRVTSPFGWRTSPITGKREFHTGIDLVKSHQAPIYAFTPGEVIHAKEGATGSGFGGYGVVVAIRDPKTDHLHCYAHLDSAVVKVGQRVERGQMIGRQGSTGQSTGSHLHYEIRKSSSPQFGWIADRENNCFEPTQYLIDYYQKEEEERVLEELRKQVTELQREVASLRREVVTLSNQVGVLLSAHAMDEVPAWAKEAVDAAVKAGIVDTPEGGSYDFYRVLTVMHRKGLI
jgi:murein DD-endopeptidase MepM/ murein hydrolase activator NlpD